MTQLTEKRIVSYHLPCRHGILLGCCNVCMDEMDRVVSFDQRRKVQLSSKKKASTHKRSGLTWYDFLTFLWILFPILLCIAAIVVIICFDYYLTGVAWSVIAFILSINKSKASSDLEALDGGPG